MVIFWSEVQLYYLAHGLVDATATPLSLLQQNPEWFILLVQTHPDKGL